MGLAARSKEFLQRAEAGARAKCNAFTSMFMTIAAQYDEGLDEERVITVCVIVNGWTVREVRPIVWAVVYNRPPRPVASSHQACFHLNLLLNVSSQCTPRAPPTTVAAEPGPATASEEVCV